ncbi:ATP-binding cassette domain-containing protein [Flavobacteriales bacterium]|jgi:ABC-2 type transport system ATP-binding protein|nr:ATP-binding cassette domain-containing protein [Crocinitomicaceae bacterium]MDA7743477.1 ATP-binding cassette domain-containing protein [Flavobacteriales bacterium]
MAISIQNVSKKFGNQMALSNVSLEVPPAQVLGLLGPNGAGKSTLMRLISGYFPATDGTVSVCGFDVLGQPMEARSCVGYLPEHNPIHTDMYVREYLEYTAGLHGIKDVSAAVSSMIEKVGLTPESHKLIGQLSKGYRQRVGIAQALIHDPKVLILDEPTSGLDPIQLVDIRELIREVGRDRTVILSTHIMQEVEEVCDRVVLIHQGAIVADGALSAFASKPGGLESAFQELKVPS